MSDGAIFKVFFDKITWYWKSQNIFVLFNIWSAYNFITIVHYCGLFKLSFDWNARSLWGAISAQGNVNTLQRNSTLSGSVEIICTRTASVNGVWVGVGGCWGFILLCECLFPNVHVTLTFCCRSLGVILSVFWCGPHSIGFNSTSRSVRTDAVTFCVACVTFSRNLRISRIPKGDTLPVWRWPVRGT